MHHASENDSMTNYGMELIRKHGYVYAIDLGPVNKFNCDGARYDC
jgi:hypothetical protein